MAKKNTAKEEVAVMRPGFLALADFNMDQTMAEELEGLEGGFDRVKIPAGGATMFELPGDEADEPEGVKEFSAVILYHHPLQQYYATKYTGGSNPPDCGSFDGIMGEGEPGGVCANCPLNQFGSGENNSKACKNRRRVFLLREGGAVPADPLPAHRLHEGVLPVHQAAAFQRAEKQFGGDAVLAEKGHQQQRHCLLPGAVFH